MKIQNVIIFLGPPGSGKGTQGRLVAPIVKYNYLSMGQYLRDYATRDTELAAKIKVAVDAGHIIPDDWIRDIFAEAIEKLPQAEGLILDGFPRDVGQAPILDSFMAQHQTKSLRVVFIEVPKQKLIDRIMERGGDRADDNVKVLHTRFDEYEQKTYPLKKYFEDRGVLLAIHGDQSIEGTHQDILDKLGLYDK